MTIENKEQIYNDIFYTTKDLCSILRIGKNRANDLMRQKDFPSIKLGGKYIVAKSDLDKFIERWKNKEYNF